MKTQTHREPEARAIVATVHIAASPESVWNASAQPDKLRRWWGCDHMPMTVCENDLRVGGGYRFVGREPDGTEHEFTGTYREVEPFSRIVHTETYAPFPGSAALVTVTYEPRDGGTDLTSRIEFPDDATFGGACASGMEPGMAAAIDRLAALAESRELSITRLVDVPRERLYAAYTDAETLKRWFVPRPWSIVDAEVDPRPGGVFRSTMRSPEGQEFPNEGIVLEAVPNELLVWTDAFGPGWEPKPDPFMVATVTFADEDGKTRYTATACHWSVEARERHEAMGFEKGWNQALDQLIEVAGE